MFLRSLFTMRGLALVVLILMISLTGFAQDQPQTQPNKQETLFEPIEYLPVFKKIALPEKKLMEDEEFNKLIMDVYNELKGSWLKNRLYNELFGVMKTNKSELFKTFLDDYFSSTLGFEWKVADFEALTMQYGLNEGREKIEKLMTENFDYDIELTIRLPFLFYYQKTFTKTAKDEVLTFLKKLQSKLEKPANDVVHNYYWMSMLRLAAGDTSTLEEIQDWMFTASFNNNNAPYLNSENFEEIMIQAQARNITERNVDSNAWGFVIESALKRNVLKEVNALFAKTLDDKEFNEKKFDDRLKAMNPNLHAYYSVVCLLNGEEESIEKVAELINRLGNMYSLVNTIERNDYNKKYAPNLLKLMMSRLSDNNYGTRNASREAMRRLLLFAKDIDAKTVLDIAAQVEKVNLDTREMDEVRITLVFLAAAINDEILFTKLFDEMNEKMKLQAMLNAIRSQFYRSADYFNEDLRRIMGKKLLSIIPDSMPFSDYSVFDVLKHFVEVKEIAKYILAKIPEWYTSADIRGRKYYFSYESLKTIFNKLADLFPKKTAQLLVSIYIYLRESENLYESSRVSIQEVFARCGINCAGYIQQLYELTNESNYLYLLSTLKTEDIAGFVYAKLNEIKPEPDVQAKIIENLSKTIRKENSTIFAPLMKQNGQEQSTKLAAFIATMRIMVN